MHVLVTVALISTTSQQLPVLPAALARHAWSYSADQLGLACDDARRSRTTSIDRR